MSDSWWWYLLVMGVVVIVVALCCYALVYGAGRLAWTWSVVLRGWLRHKVRGR